METCDDGVIVGKDGAIQSEERNGASIGAKKEGGVVKKKLREVNVGDRRVLNQGTFPVGKGKDVVLPGEWGGERGRGCEGDWWKGMDGKGVAVVGEVHW